MGVTRSTTVRPALFICGVDVTPAARPAIRALLLPSAWLQWSFREAAALRAILETFSGAGRQVQLCMADVSERDENG